MTYTVERREIEARPTAVIRTTTVPQELAKVFSELLPEVAAYLEGAGVDGAGPSFARYFEFRPDRVDMEVGFIVPAAVAGGGRVSPSELPAGEVAVTWHVGPYATLAGAYQAIEAWVAEQGLSANGPSWEVYWTDPQVEPDSSTWRTEVVWPCRAVSGPAATPAE